MATCTSACPVKNRNLEKLQEEPEIAWAKTFHSLDLSRSFNDTPERLKEYAKTYHANPAGISDRKKENVDWALYKIGQYVPDKQNHINVVVIGNESTGLWKKAFGLAKEEDLVKVFASVLNDKTPATN